MSAHRSRRSMATARYAVGSVLDWRPLADAIEGDLFLPGRPGYDRVRVPPIPLFQDVRPAAVIRARSESDVAAALAFAGGSDLPAVVRSGGHSFAGLSSTEGILIDLAEIDTLMLSGDVASIGAGARLGSVYEALYRNGLTIAGGSESTVGVSGLTLGGGVGILGRGYGLTCDQLVAARVVLPDGEVVDCDERREPDLFWALRGGGGLGVVTQLVLQTVPESEMTTFHLIWAEAQAAALIAAWQDWAPAGPDGLSASLLLTAGPNPQEAPTAHIFGAAEGNRPHAESLLAELIARVGRPQDARVQSAPSCRQARATLAEVGDGLAAHAHGPDAVRRHGWHKSEFFERTLPSDGGAAVIDLLRDRPPGVGCELDFMPWGAAYNRVDPGATAFVHRRDRFLLRYAVSVDEAAGAGLRSEADDWLDRTWRTLHPYGTGRAYQNFPDPTLEDDQHAYFGSNLPRLERVRAHYDPDGILTP